MALFQCDMNDIIDCEDGDMKFCVRDGDEIMEMGWDGENQWE